MTRWRTFASSRAAGTGRRRGCRGGPRDSPPAVSVVVGMRGPRSKRRGPRRARRGLVVSPGAPTRPGGSKSASMALGPGRAGAAPRTPGPRRIIASAGGSPIPVRDERRRRRGPDRTLAAPTPRRGDVFRWVDGGRRGASENARPRGTDGPRRDRHRRRSMPGRAAPGRRPASASPGGAAPARWRSTRGMTGCRASGSAGYRPGCLAGRAPRRGRGRSARAPVCGRTGRAASRGAGLPDDRPRRAGPAGTIPRADELPDLPDAWVQGLSRGDHTDMPRGEFDGGGLLRGPAGRPPTARCGLPPPVRAAMGATGDRRDAPVTATTAAGPLGDEGRAGVIEASGRCGTRFSVGWSETGRAQPPWRRAVAAGHRGRGRALDRQPASPGGPRPVRHAEHARVASFRVGKQEAPAAARPEPAWRKPRMLGEHGGPGLRTGTSSATPGPG